MLNNRVAIVTGGLQGIGLAIVKELHRQGAKVAVGARRSDDPVASAEARHIIGDQGMVAALNVRSTDSVNTFVAEVTAKLGTCNILVNSAGIGVHQIVSGHSDADWEAVIDTNLNGPFRMIRACIDPMKAAGWGRIVNIASTAARTAEPTHAAYCASKSGLVGLMRAVALEGGPHGVNCVAVSPGWVETEMLRESAQIMAEKSGRTQAEEIELMAQSNPQNRLVQPEEIAGLVAYCCSETAAGLTMEDIQVNAGALW